MVGVQRIAPVLLAAWAMSACADANDCGRETITTIEDLDAIPGGFNRSVDTMLDEVVGSYTGTYTWNDSYADLTYSGSTPLRVRVSHEGGEARLVEVARDGKSPRSGILVTCSDRLEVDARLEFVTDDGAFAEDLDVVLTVESRSDGPLGFIHDLDFASHQGQLSEADYSMVGAEVESVDLSGEFFMPGEFNGRSTMTTRSANAVGFIPVASYTAAIDPG